MPRGLDPPKREEGNAYYNQFYINFTGVETLVVRREMRSKIFFNFQRDSRSITIIFNS